MFLFLGRVPDGSAQAQHHFSSQLSSLPASLLNLLQSETVGLLTLKCFSWLLCHPAARRVKVCCQVLTVT